MNEARAFRATLLARRREADGARFDAAVAAVSADVAYAPGFARSHG